MARTKQTARKASRGTPPVAKPALKTPVPTKPIAQIRADVWQASRGVEMLTTFYNHKKREAASLRKLIVTLNCQASKLEEGGDELATPNEATISIRDKLVESTRNRILAAEELVNSAHDALRIARGTYNRSMLALRAHPDYVLQTKKP